MRNSFKDSLKALEADIQHANTLASLYPKEFDGGCIQMRLSYSPAAHLFLFLVQWTDCNLAGALGLLRILIFKAYMDGKTTMSIHERKASLKEFYAVIFPSLLQLERGITDVEDRKQKEVCATKYKKKDELVKGKLSEVDLEREEECGICMEMNSKVVLPTCSHALCMKCYRDWRARSQSCPFCRDSLKRVDSGDLWMYTDHREIIDMSSICRENLKRLYLYIDKLPLLVPDTVFIQYDSLMRKIQNLTQAAASKSVELTSPSLGYVGYAKYSREHSSRAEPQDKIKAKRGRQTSGTSNNARSGDLLIQGSKCKLLLMNASSFGGHHCYRN